MPTVVVTGANRGLGLEFARQYAADGWTVIATVREPGEASELEALAGDIAVEPLDVRDFAAVAKLGERIGDRAIDLLVANAGTLGPRRIESAEDAGDWVGTLEVNSVAPLLLARTLLGNVAAAKGRMIAVTSRMGSIADNDSGGYVAYRSSKAALNAAWKSLAIDVAGQSVIAVLLHPGWVQTRMGGAGAPLEPSQSVAGMRRVIAGLTPEQSGGFFSHDGSTIPW